jgi:hypothetical protein
MDNIEKIKELMKQAKSIEELIDTISKEEITAFYMRHADESLKKEQDINPAEIWHRFFVETSSTPVNKWENISNYTVVLISDDLRELKIIGKQ